MSGNAHMSCVNGSGGEKRAPKTKIATTAYFHLSRNVSYWMIPEYERPVTRSGICPASPNDSERKTMNSVHITMEYVGCNPASSPKPAKNENIIGKNA